MVAEWADMVTLGMASGYRGQQDMERPITGTAKMKTLKKKKKKNRADITSPSSVGDGNYILSVAVFLPFLPHLMGSSLCPWVLSASFIDLLCHMLYSRVDYCAT